MSRIGRAVGILVPTAALLAGGVLAYQALETRSALVTAVARFEEAGEHLRGGDAAAARDAVQEAGREAAHAEQLTSGPLWDLAAHAPVLGDDVAAVRTVAEISHRLADRVLLSVVTVGETLDPDELRAHDGRVDLEPLVHVRDLVVDADQELRELEATAAGIETQSLIPQLAGPVERMQRELSDAAELSAAASSAVRLLPPMLGGEGARNYLVLFQNNAEMRATGGIPGAVAVLRADNGRLTIERQGNLHDLGFDEVVPSELTDEETALYGTKLAAYGADMGLTPDFPRAARLARDRWLWMQGQRVDGVLATDPVALSYLLDATGPVEVPDGSTLAGSNAVERLLSEVYLTEPDRAAQDAFFAGAARAVFRHVLSAPGDAESMLEALMRSADEGRLLVWSGDRGEQALIAGTRLGGVLPREAGSAPFVGVFLNDGTAAKMQYYLDHRVDVRPVGCDAGGRQDLEVTVTLRSTAPDDAARLPESVIGWRSKSDLGPRVRPGHMRLNVHVYAPVGGAVESLRVDGRDAPVSVVEHLGHPVGSQTVELAPGEVHRLVYVLSTGAGQSGIPELRVTPGVRSSGVGTVGASACEVG